MFTEASSKGLRDGSPLGTCERSEQGTSSLAILLSFLFVQSAYFWGIGFAHTLKLGVTS